ncbi:MAG TPA: hypothetical protein DEP23_04695 [Ruminococcaceae bacterium]|nr:hypothetical protein [Oscillospiraceae bacterium]
MRRQTITIVYVTTYVSKKEHGVTVGGYTNLRTAKLNAQTDYSTLDMQEYGQTVNEIIKLRSNQLPNINKGDYLYFTKPEKQGTFDVGSVTYDDYGTGEYQVESIRPSFKGIKTVRNPTLILARKQTAEKL